MISYKLARKLKEEGFPQKEGERRDDIICSHDPIVPYSRAYYGHVLADCNLRAYIPTLSELIDECGKKGVKKVMLEFQSNNLKTITAETLAVGPYPSFDECAAELWLKLT